MLERFVDEFPRTRSVVDDLRSDQPDASAGHSGPLTLAVASTLGKVPNPFFRLGSSTGRPVESLKRSRPPVCLAGWSNYTSAEDEPQVVNQLPQTQEGMCYCLFFDTLNELQSFLGVGHVVLPKLALTKFKPD